ncbi:MAG: NAD kinase [Paludibacteraceae bacterium]|nr:NAD kinase [Paludibacteraceae bacterium]
MTVVVFGNNYRKETLEQVEILFRLLQEHNISVGIETIFYNFLCNDLNFKPCVDFFISDDNFDADLALSIGGDGTFLKTASHVGNKNIPILGINTGRLGFLADISGEEIVAAFDDILNNRYRIEERTVLQVKTSDSNEIFGYALNEVAVLKQDTSSMITVHTKLNEEFLTDFQSDGLIVSTPTGSTAYSMSVGGPLVLPQSKNFILAAVAPHSLNIRPLVIPDDFKIELEVKSRLGCYLISLDGRSAVLNQSTKIFVQKSDFTLKLLKRENYTYYNTLRNKLMWGVDKRTI